jgi:hypothetical protein
VEIHIDSSNDVPIRRQLIEQIIFLIATERLKDGDFLPSVRELARRAFRRATGPRAGSLKFHRDLTLTGGVLLLDSFDSIWCRARNSGPEPLSSGGLKLP